MSAEPRIYCERVGCGREIVAGVILVREASVCEPHGLQTTTRVFCNYQCALHWIAPIVRAERRQFHARAREIAALERMVQEPEP